jgi:glycosyltransferase involved in cell wall biosynthesis
VDSVLNVDESKRRNDLAAIINDRFNFIHIAPKPNIYQGKDRKTSKEYFSPANARNTGIKYASGDYCVFVDDVSVLSPSWLETAENYHRENKIVCGAYRKDFEMNVQSGVLVSSRQHPLGVDVRLRNGKRRITGSEFFGSSFGIPKSVFNSVGGFDEICDSVGGEDYHFGIRLERAGQRIHYDPAMSTVESEELHNQPYLMLREDRVLPQDKYMERLKSFGVNRRHRQGNWDSSHMILDILYGKNQIQSIGITDNELHWFDGKPLAEM